MTTFDRIKEIIQLYDPTIETVLATDQLESGIGFDSLELIELYMHVEEQFGITVNDADALAWNTVGDVVAYVDRRLADG